ncbi:hypothetical protein F4810DRAFT_589840 [Camillea tinctor]|nr:hypothetical protein F4810DRAFT_589840 [Camillea tinctor]
MAEETPRTYLAVPLVRQEEGRLEDEFTSSSSTLAASSRVNIAGPHDTEPLCDEQAMRGKEEMRKRRKIKSRKASSSWWWWWEIGGSLLSIIGLSLVIPVLKMVDNKPIESWPYTISPNSMISVLTTVTRTAMMVPIASCFSQLKWDHFQYRSNPLDHLQLYDDASRGPWGSFLLIFTGRLRVITAWALALITLVALAIEPTAQQILEPLNRQAPLPNVTAQIGRAQNYSSKAIWSGSLHSYGGPRNPNGQLLSLQTSIANGAVGSVPEVNIYCPQPASKCTWDQFSTLAVCSSFENFTNTMNPTYVNDTIWDIYTYNFSRGDNVIIYSSKGDMGRALFNTSGSLYNSDGIFEAVLNGARSVDYMSGASGFDTFSITWSWCVKTYYNVVASPVGIEEANYTSEPLLLDNTILNGIQPWNTYFANSSRENFNVTVSLASGLWQYLDKLFTRELQSPLTGEAVDTDFSIGEFMYFADLANLTKNVEDTLSNQIRSSSPGDNEWAELWPGQAFYEETYWHVRWAWITLPATEVLLTALLLLISIIWTKGQPLFKSSALALLYHGFDNPDENESLLEKQNSMSKLESAAKNINVEFKKVDNGVLRFVRVGNKG